MTSERLHMRGRMRLWWIGWRYRHGFYHGPTFDNVEEMLDYCFGEKVDYMPSEERITGGCIHYIPDMKCVECDERNRCDASDSRTCPKCEGESVQTDCEIVNHCKDCGFTWIGHDGKVKP